MKRIFFIIIAFIYCEFAYAQKSIPNNVIFVDLGLPSKTLWANMNIGAETVEDYGFYFAWLDTEPKEDYSIATVRDYSDTKEDFVIYKEGGLMQTFSLGGPEDAAGWNWGEDCHTPTVGDIVELLDNCKFIFTTVNNKSGFKVIGPNGNSIFLPAAGSKIGKDEIDGKNIIAMYWTNRVCKGSEWGGVLHLNKGGFKNYDGCYRHWGNPVRAVKDKWSLPNINDIEIGWSIKDIAASSISKMKQQKQLIYNNGSCAISFWTIDKIVLLKINTGILDTIEDPGDKVLIKMSYYDEDNQIVLSASSTLTVNRYYYNQASVSDIDCENIINYLINRKGFIVINIPVYQKPDIEIKIPCLNN